MGDGAFCHYCRKSPCQCKGSEMEYTVDAVRELSGHELDRAVEKLLFHVQNAAEDQQEEL